MNFELEVEVEQVEKGIDDIIKNSSDEELNCRNLISFIEDEKIKVTELGKIFIRNVCMGFAFYLKQKDTATRFSRTI